MLNIIIIEDEQKVLDTIVEILNKHCKVNIIGAANSVATATQLLQENSPDLVLLDVNLPDGTSFDILNQLEEHNFGIIFITAFEEYALKAIKFSALDYLLKPINYLELVDAIKRAEKSFEKDKNDIKLKALLSNIRSFSDNLKKVVLNTAESIYLIDIQDVTRCNSDGSYTVFYLADGRKIMVSKVLKEYAEMLEDYGFIRVHKSHLININHLERIEKNNGYFVVMKDKAEVPVSVRKREKLVSILNSL
jgi:two-component system, LytTR family, response regulator